MKNALSSSLFFAVLVCVVVAYAQQTPHQGPPYPLRPDKPEWSITMTAARDTVKAGEELKVKVAERNISKKDLWISAEDRSVRRSLAFKVFVRDAQGVLLPPTEFGRKLYNRGWTRSSPLVYCHPGEELPPEEIDVSKLYELKPGKYTLQARPFAAYDPDLVLSNTVTVTVTQ